MSGSQWSATCQDWLSQYCCTQQENLAASPDCQTLLACINACPSHAHDACIQTCAGNAPSAAIGAKDDIAACSKTTPVGGTAIPRGLPVAVTSLRGRLTKLQREC